MKSYGLNPQEIEDLIYEMLMAPPDVANYRVGPLQELCSELSENSYNEICARAIKRVFVAKRKNI